MHLLQKICARWARHDRLLYAVAGESGIALAELAARCKIDAATLEEIRTALTAEPETPDAVLTKPEGSDGPPDLGRVVAPGAAVSLIGILGLLLEHSTTLVRERAQRRHEIRRALDDDIRPGELIGIVGRSGSGKSTFLRCLNGLEVASAGSVWVHGVSVHDPLTDLNTLRADIGMVFQRFNLFPHKTVLQNITLAPTRVRGLELA